MPDRPIPHPLYHITLLRHGQSVGNAEGYYQGQSDFPLTDCGRSQAQALAGRWQAEGVCFEQIISSPLARARETAEIIAVALNVPIDLDANWMERNNGILTGMKQEEVAERHPRPSFVNPYQAFGETGEGQWQLYLRAGRAIREMVSRPIGRYLVVSHGGILNMAMYALLGIPPQANYQGPRFRFHNTAFATLNYNPERHIWTLERFNDRTHWQNPG